jgi:hypothetical protein
MPVLDTAPSTPSNGSGLVTIKYNNFRGKDSGYPINIKVYYKERPCYALYDGVTEVPAENKTWANVEVKTTTQSGSGSGNWETENQVSPNKNIYVLKN